VHQPPLSIYRSLLAEGVIVPDPHQDRAAVALDELWHELVMERRRRFWHRLTSSTREPVRGLYLWGGVGRGKTWLMDLFFEALPVRRKQRIHFHRFMARVHAELKVHGSLRDPLSVVAREWSERCRVLCFDEFFVSDIADAMLLAGLLKGLFESGTVLVATSNLRPDDLYRDGLQRARFLPAIELLNAHMHVLELGGDRDFRLRILKRTEIYHHPLDEDANEALARGFDRMCGGIKLATGLLINGRDFCTRKRGDGIIWFDFEELCLKPRSTIDFIEIARSFNTVLLSNVPVMSDLSNDAARRFINLVDEFYDRNVKLLISAASPATDIYAGTRLTFEFQRTISRLTEMQSHEYLAKPHLP
jgi:cell division protein ZapE